MISSASGILKIIFFIVIGIVLRYRGIFKKTEIDGLKKIVLYIALPSTLFISFSKLEFDLTIIPITLSIIAVNLLIFIVGIMIMKLSRSHSRLFVLSMSTMNFGLLGLPLYEASYGIEQLHNYSVFGVGCELYVWSVFFIMLKLFLSGTKDSKVIHTEFLKSPVLWGLLAGCFAGMLGVEISEIQNAFVMGLFRVVQGSSSLTTPLILIYIGYNLSVSVINLRFSIKLVLIRLLATYLIGYSIKTLILDRFIEPDPLFNSAYFLLMSLPAVFSVPILASDYINSEETSVLNNTLVLHMIFTIVIFSIYTLFT